MRELDVLVEGFYVQRYPTLTPNAQQAFRTLLKQTDPELLDWLLGRALPPAELSELVAQMQVFKRTATNNAGS
jgi:succinate dehydrogenase flavin-adding protein (antitoxin of CptAB toxin-antitoxin module)